MPQLLAEGTVRPNEQLVVRGDTLLERAQNALGLLRDKALSGQKMVWRVADEDWDAESGPS